MPNRRVQTEERRKARPSRGATVNVNVSFEEVYLSISRLHHRGSRRMLTSSCGPRSPFPFRVPEWWSADYATATQTTLLSLSSCLMPTMESVLYRQAHRMLVVPFPFRRIEQCFPTCSSGQEQISMWPPSTTFQALVSSEYLP